jgi:hypothetical protein
MAFDLCCGGRLQQNDGPTALLAAIVTDAASLVEVLQRAQPKEILVERKERVMRETWRRPGS